MKNVKFIMVGAVLCTLVACKSQRQSVGSYYQTSPPECLGQQMDGFLTLSVWGQGATLEEARLQALQEAVRAVIFDGIKDGNRDCDSKPLVTGVNAKEKYQSYFQQFFASGGLYLHYVSASESEEVDEKIIERKVRKKVRVKVRVDSYHLKQQLINDKII